MLANIEVNPEKPIRLLRIDQVMELVPLAKSTIYQAVAAGKFPKPYKIGAQTSAWLECEVNEWITEKVAQ